MPVAAMTRHDGGNATQLAKQFASFKAAEQTAVAQALTSQQPPAAAALHDLQGASDQTQGAAHGTSLACRALTRKPRPSRNPPRYADGGVIPLALMSLAPRNGVIVKSEVA